MPHRGGARLRNWIIVFLQFDSLYLWQASHVSEVPAQLSAALGMIKIEKEGFLTFDSASIVVTLQPL